MRNFMLHTAPTSLFGSLVTTLDPYIGQHINEATHTLVDLGEVETIKAWKGVWATTERRGAKGPTKVLSIQMWVDLIKLGAVKEKLDGKASKILF